MRGLVKLNELEEVGEPPLGGLPETSTSGFPKDDMQGLEEKDTTLEDEGKEAQFIPGESQLGLL